MNQAPSTSRKLAGLFLLLMASMILAGCGSFGRKFNQALPDFLRSDPGADELERYQARIRVLNRSKEEAARAKEAFKEAKSLYDKGDYENAAVAFELFLEDYPDTVDDRLCRHLLILCYLELEEDADARRGIQAFVRLYPISELNDEIEESAWRLANEYLEGKHSWFIFNLESDGVTMLRLIVTSFPNGHHADEAQWKLGNYLFDEDNFIEAEAAYATIVERYPRSPWAPRALLNQGLCHVALCKGAAYDQENMYAGIRIFERYLESYPEADRREEAKEHIAWFKNTLAEKQLLVANWYIDQGYPTSARFYLRKCMRLWPDSPAASASKELLATLPDISEDSFFRELEERRAGTGQPVEVAPPAGGGGHSHGGGH